MGRTKKVKMDRLSQRALEATKASMSYGKYIALYHPVNVPQVQKKQKSNHICLQCGKEIILRNFRERKFCDDLCREQYYEKCGKSGPQIKHCAICGAEFETNSGIKKYCSEACVKIGTRQCANAWRARKAVERDGKE